MKWRIKEKEVNGKTFYIPQYRKFLSPIWHTLRLNILLDIEEEYCICCNNTEIRIEKEDESILCVPLLYKVDTYPGLIGFYGYKRTEYIPGLKNKEDANELIKIIQSQRMKIKL